MSAPTRADLEVAAMQFFDEAKRELDAPRDFDPDQRDYLISLNADASHSRSLDIEGQLRANEFDGLVRAQADSLALRAGTAFTSMDQALQLYALQLAARIEREKHQLLISMLTTPTRSFVHTDGLLLGLAEQRRASPAGHAATFMEPMPAGRSLKEVGVEYLASKEQTGVGASHIGELRRALGWLEETVGPGTPIGAITKEQLRSFRDSIERVDTSYRGRVVRFRSRLTDDPTKQLKSATASRYWRTIKAMFAWAFERDIIGANPAADIRGVQRKRGERRESPEPFTPAELQTLLQSPAFAGYLDARHPTRAGDVRVRGGYWWSGVLCLFTGMRAGELSQLLQSDFVFDDEIPHLKIQKEDGSGRSTKSVKNYSSIRDVPLAPSLLALGLRQFVEGRRGSRAGTRVFREFRLGSGGRKSDGMTKWWGDYLKQVGIWKKGRATHVFRHTVTACLRAAGLPEEDIGALFGHSTGTVTAGYGGPHPLARKLKSIERLDFGFDVVELLGGPYDPKRHV